MIELENMGYSDENIKLFFDKIELLRVTINSIPETGIAVVPSASRHITNNKRVDVNQRPEISNDCHFTDLSLLPIYYNNVRCITNKRNICMKIELSFYMVLVLTETWLSSEQSSSIYFPNKFDIYRYDKVVTSRQQTTTRRSGGVAVLVNAKLDSRRIIMKQDADCECLAIEIKLKPRPLLIYAVYMKEFDFSIAMKHFQLINELLSTFKKHRIIVLGDFNLHDINWSIDEMETHYLPSGISTHKSQYFRQAAEFLEKMESASLYQLSNVKNIASNVLDLLFVNEVDDVKLCVDQQTLIDSDQQDVYHQPYEISLPYSDNDTCSKNENVEIFCYKRGNYSRMCQQMNNINFQFEFERRDIDSALSYFYDVMTTLISNNVPKIKIKNYFSKPKWWTSEL